jgi:uncharacterized protein YecE (DUF72 family)
LKIGCSGFPVARDRYFRELEAVELHTTFYKLPKLSTAERWAAERPRDFQLTIAALQLITHLPDSPTYEKLGRSIPEKLKGRYGHFRPTEEVRSAWESTAAIAKACGASAVLFQTPAAFYANSNTLRDMYAFFKWARRERLVFAWEARGAWDDKIVERICRDLDLVRSVDPLAQPCGGRVVYARLRGPLVGRRFDSSHVYTNGELQDLLGAVGERPGWVFLNNKSMWTDARRLKALSIGGPAPRVGGRF